MIDIHYFTFGEFQENTYILYDQTRECVIIDPGCYKSREQSQLVAFIEENGLKPVKLLNTHCHIDHVLGNAFVMQKYNIPLYMHEGELFTYKDTARWTVMLGIPPLEIPENLKFVTEKDVITFGNSELKIAFTPGHSIASITFHHPEQGFAIAGDVLFMESIGRTDLPGGNYETLIQSIRNILFAWPDETKIYPGHGYPTTIGHEKQFNPFLANG
jgi:glyoxylase-like metal-dependent hydrolase (beta-lactamase superfamily II)